MCDCIDRVNSELAKHNTKLVVPMWTASGRLTPFVETTKLDTKQRGKAKALFATFCPFCGEKYETERAALAKAGESTRQGNVVRGRL